MPAAPLYVRPLLPTGPRLRHKSNYSNNPGVTRLHDGLFMECLALTQPRGLENEAEKMETALHRIAPESTLVPIQRNFRMRMTSSCGAQNRALVSANFWMTAASC